MAPIMSTRRPLGAPAVRCELDDVPNPYSVLSFKRVLSSYHGPLARLRRLGDDAEADFHPRWDGWLDAIAATAWAPGGAACVRIYDQLRLGGVSRDAVQPTASAQPRFMLRNGKPVAAFASADGHFLQIENASTNFAGEPGGCLLAVGRLDNVATENFLLLVRNNTSALRANLRVLGSADGHVWNTRSRRLSGTSDSLADVFGPTNDERWHVALSRFDAINAAIWLHLDGMTFPGQPFQDAGNYTTSTSGQLPRIGCDNNLNASADGEGTLFALFAGAVPTPAHAQTLIARLQGLKP